MKLEDARFSTEDLAQAIEESLGIVLDEEQTKEFHKSLIKFAVERHKVAAVRHRERSEVMSEQAKLRMEQAEEYQVLLDRFNVVAVVPPPTE